MKKNDILSLVSLLASPVALILLGSILLFCPDSVSVFAAKLLGWILLAVGVGFAVAAFTKPMGTAGNVLAAIVCLVLGSWLLKNPLLLAKSIGRFVGILLAIRGIRDFLQSGYRQGKLLALVTAVLGVVLIALPMTTSRVVFSACGLVVLVVGIAMLVDRLRRRRLPGGDNDPNIIDAL